MNGGTLFFCNTLACVPYFFFHTNSCGSNVVAHSMWPHKSCIQWHTLHHVAHSDVYAINVPSDNDEKFSRDVKQYRERLQCSPFIRYSFVSDLAGFAMIFVVGFALHYCGIGLFHVWNERLLHLKAWKETQPNPRCAVSFPEGPRRSLKIQRSRVPLKRASRFFRDVSLGKKRGNIPSAPCLLSFSTNLGGGSAFPNVQVWALNKIRSKYLILISPSRMEGDFPNKLRDVAWRISKRCDVGSRVRVACLEPSKPKDQWPWSFLSPCPIHLPEVPDCQGLLMMMSRFI